MRPTSLAEVAAMVAGDLIGDSEQPVLGAAADNRRVSPGDLFVAIRGDRVDGHDFAESALANGAVATLAQHEVPGPHILVADTVAALGRLANRYLETLEDTRVVAVTGSSGKTTTKDLLASVLRHHGPVVAPVGSFNTEVGLPLTVLQADDATRTLVLEMGARGTGHIDYLCSIARPDIAVMLNVGSAHLGEFGDRATLAAAKAEIVSSLSPRGVAVLNGDDPLVTDVALPDGVERVRFGLGEVCDLRITDLELDNAARPCFTMSWQGQQAAVQLRLHGEHNAHNAAAVAAVAVSMGMPLSSVAEALAQAGPASPHRMDVRVSPTGITVVNDAYNANPESMAAALKTLARLAEGAGRSWAVLGEMLELGPDSLTEHDRIGRLAVRLDIDRLVVIGAGARPMYLGAAQEGSWGDEAAWVPDVAEALRLVESGVREGDVVLVKASRAVGLESVAERLLGATP
ncbi:MAG: UDP-N-acetylmuramoyl-tripeptide--D-alanyl-D-alanine ligase [Actinobacteria bacterium]|nr:UDP-N-acetylmuramoyl-tripeptide--D-alanyl-D-alanine ligase [Actinomycetota bacterium]